MKRFLIILLALCTIFLVSCKNKNTAEDAVASFEATVIEVYEKSLLVEPSADSEEIRSADRINVSFAGADLTDIKAGNTVVIEYDGSIAESYPAQINGTSVKVIYNWGITLTAESVTSTGMTLVCTQSGGKLTGELNTGEDYFLEIKTDDGWESVPTVIDDYGWNSIAYMVTLEGESGWSIDWEWIYGSLEPGEYRIGKSIMDFRESGDYDTAVFYAEFEISE